jgi:hypothetical protein
VYKDKGWVGYGDWLGTSFLPFTEARDFVRKLGLKNYHEWNDWRTSDKRPKNIPSSPRSVYANKGWCGIQDWLGTTKKDSWRREEDPGT